MPNYLTAIIVCNLPGGRHQFLKYRNIPEARVPKLIKFAATIPDAHHVNLYRKDTKQFERQIKPEEIKAAALQ